VDARVIYAIIVGITGMLPIMWMCVLFVELTYYFVVKYVLA
jgi:hypothetical protein